MRRSSSPFSLVSLLLLVAGVSAVAAQSVTERRGPQFLLASVGPAKAPVVVDAGSVASLRRRIGLNLDGVRVGDALAEIARVSGLQIVYADGVVPSDASVHLKAEEITVAAALTEVLLDAKVDVVLSPGGSLVLVKRGTVVTGSVAGRVTDAKTGQPIPSASVVLEGTKWRAVTDADGHYRIADVAAGTYTLTVSRIGYARQSQSVTVAAEQEVAVDVRIQAAPTRLEQVVVTGTIVPTEVRALPSPVTLITAADVDLQRPQSITQIVRRAVPSAVAWDLEGSPQQTSMSLRGANSLISGVGTMKVYIDGIEVENPSNAAIDPTSIERVEVIRGPQAATIYGSDAIGGVMQVFTKRGDSTATRPEVDVSSALAVVQTSYDGFGSTVRQQYGGSVRGASRGLSYSIGGSYTHVGDWVPQGAQSLPSIYAGIRIDHERFTLDFTGRYYEQALNSTFNPVFANTGFNGFSKPYYQAVRTREQSLGAELTWATLPWLRQDLTIGIDQYPTDTRQTQPRLTTSADTFLFVLNSNYSKLSVRYDASVSGNVANELSTTVTAGIDHYDYSSTLYYTFGALNTTGAITTDPNQPLAGSRNDVRNTGYFAQGQLGYRSRLYATAGLRVEDNSSFGSALHTPLSPRVGLSYVTGADATTIKVRASYGEAIHPPQPGWSETIPLGGTIQLANPKLGPERQKGWDAGLDVVLGARTWLSATYYNQTADDLIQYVLLAAGPPAQYQYQNVGRVKNKGFELEGTLDVGRAHLKAQFAITDSRIQDLGPNYTGDMKVGDHPFAIPTYTAGASLTFSVTPRTTVSGGLTYVGDQRDYDFYPFFGCLAGTQPCRGAFSNYIVSYAGFAKVDVSIHQRLGHFLSGFISVQNVGNTTASEFTTFAPVMGRISTIGLEAHY